MIRKLWKYELYKVLFSYRGLWLVAAFIILKIAVLCVLPELKDHRITMSQKQYDKVLAAIAGETTSEKERYITETYGQYLLIIDKFKENQDRYLAGEIEEKAWKEYTTDYDNAKLYINAFSIFDEKAWQFSKLRSMGELPPPAYFYEYGWNSMFTYMGYPDHLSILLILALGIQFICPEISSGTMQIILATRHGRRPLFFSKLAALLTLLCAVALFNTVLESSIFSARFSLIDGHWPIYSITSFASSPVRLSLTQGLFVLSVIRGTGLVLAGALFWTAACLTGNAAQGAFCSFALVLLPWLLIPNMIYTVNAWLSGVPVLKAEYWLVPLLILCSIITTLLWLAYQVRFGRKQRKNSTAFNLGE